MFFVRVFETIRDRESHEYQGAKSSERAYGTPKEVYGIARIHG
jgi:hypothetical protein